VRQFSLAIITTASYHWLQVFSEASILFTWIISIAIKIITILKWIYQSKRTLLSCLNIYLEVFSLAYFFDSYCQLNTGLLIYWMNIKLFFIAIYYGRMIWFLVSIINLKSYCIRITAWFLIKNKDKNLYFFENWSYQLVLGWQLPDCRKFCRTFDISFLWDLNLIYKFHFPVFLQTAYLSRII